MSLIVVDEEIPPDLEPPPRLPSPESPISSSTPPEVETGDGVADEDTAEASDDEAIIKSNATKTQPAERLATLHLHAASHSPSHRRPWGLRSPVMGRLSLYSDSSLSPLSPLRRQFSSPLMPSPVDMSKDGAGDADDELDTDELEGIDRRSETESLTQDSKDVLVERLNDLVQHLTMGRRCQGADISALHAKVDEMERLIPMAKKSRPRRRDSVQSPSQPDSQKARLGSPLPLVQQEDKERLSQQSPELKTPTKSHRLASPLQAVELLTSSTPLPASANVKVSSEVADRVVAEAEKLNTELATVLQNMKSRSVESDHLHGMLIERAEGAAMRILELEGAVSELAKDLGDTEAELKHLRLRMRAIEAMFHDRMAQDVDPVLLQSVENWKADWASLRERMSTKKKDRKTRHGGNDDNTTITNMSSP